MVNYNTNSKNMLFPFNTKKTKRIYIQNSKAKPNKKNSTRKKGARNKTIIFQLDKQCYLSSSLSLISLSSS